MKTFNLIEKVILFSILLWIPSAFYDKIHNPGVLKELLLKIFISVWILFCLIKSLQTKQVVIAHNNISCGVILFLILSECSLILSDYKIIGIARLELITYFVIFYFLVSQMVISNQNSVHSSLEIASFTGFIVSVHGIVQSFGIDFAYQRDLSRVFATFAHPNFLAGYLVAVIPLTTGIFLSCPKSMKRTAYGLSIAAQSICLLLTLSRSAFISTGVSIIFFSFIMLICFQKSLSFRLNKKKLVIAVLVLCMATVTFLLIIRKLPESEITRLTSVNTVSKLNTVRMRWLEWKGTVNIIKKNPIIGNGPGTFSIFFPANQTPEFASLSVERNEFLRHAHNEYLEIWSETGTLGVIVFLYVLLATIISGYKIFILNNNGNCSVFVLLGLISGLIGISFHMIFSVSCRSVPVGLIFWFYAGVISGLSQREKKKPWNLTKKRIYAVVSLFLLVFFLLYFSLGKTISHVRAETYFYKGLADYKSGKLKDALHNMQLALDHNKCKPEIYYKKGAVEVRLKKWPDALATYLTLKRIHPDFFHINFNLSLCYLSLKDTDNSIVSGKREIDLYPDYARQYYLLAKAFSLNKNYNDARKYFEKYLQLRSQNAHSFVPGNYRFPYN